MGRVHWDKPDGGKELRLEQSCQSKSPWSGNDNIPFGQPTPTPEGRKDFRDIGRRWERHLVTTTVLGRETSVGRMVSVTQNIEIIEEHFMFTTIFAPIQKLPPYGFSLNHHHHPLSKGSRDPTIHTLVSPCSPYTGPTPPRPSKSTPEETTSHRDCEGRYRTDYSTVSVHGPKPHNF